MHACMCVCVYWEVVEKTGRRVLEKAHPHKRQVSQCWMPQETRSHISKQCPQELRNRRLCFLLTHGCWAMNIFNTTP